MRDTREKARARLWSIQESSVHGSWINLNIRSDPQRPDLETGSSQHKITVILHDKERGRSEQSSLLIASDMDTKASPLPPMEVSPSYVE